MAYCGPTTSVGETFLVHQIGALALSAKLLGLEKLILAEVTASFVV